MLDDYNFLTCSQHVPILLRYGAHSLKNDSPCTFLTTSLKRTTVMNLSL